ncbi:MAG: UDP-N-acetylmuramoyl-tripeptide--D-alanyl-D-alanine ligase [Dermatophilaceae bacterium]|nr:UDP-N-acetylmuramoyl-tripeptide--D-alanyl-D-alanine ligase [Dermatophilaceae bacterium]
MIALRLSEIARITGGKVCEAIGTPGSKAAGSDGASSDPLVDGPVVTDSREASAGSLYVARIGESMDGHQFAPAARSQGAVAALTSRPVADLPSVVVPDVQEAFVSLAHALVERNESAVVIGITGSSGKTSTKDLLWSVLQRHGETVANVGSLNSEVGVPLTVCRITPTTAYLVLEMGARGIGHIEYLTRLASPRIGVVLNVGTAHLGEFGSREAIGRAKAELVQALPATGFAVLNADDPIVWAMASQTRAQVIGVGQSAQAAVRALDILLDAQGRASFTLVTDQGRAPVVLAFHGEHHVGNALAVAAVAMALGLPLPEVATALGDARPLSRWRMEVHERADGVTIVNDAYNANPDSMRAALKALTAMGQGQGRRTWAVLGEMLELGPDSAAEHEALGRLAVSLNVSKVIAVGQGARPIDSGARDEGSIRSAGSQSTWVPDTEAAFGLLGQNLAPGDVVLVKSSRDAGLRWLGDRLLDGTVTEVRS